MSILLQLVKEEFTQNYALTEIQVMVHLAGRHLDLKNQQKKKVSNSLLLVYGKHVVCK